MPRNKLDDSPATGRVSQKQVDFGKAQGSSRNDEADMRDVARKAAKKSQGQQPDGFPMKKDRQ
jgi:hypothetical protein